VIAVIAESLSVTCSSEDGGPKMGLTRIRFSGKDGGIRKGRSARVRYGWYG
jgi:hypothetical protein